MNAAYWVQSAVVCKIGFRLQIFYLKVCDFLPLKLFRHKKGIQGVHLRTTTKRLVSFFKKIILLPLIRLIILFHHRVFNSIFFFNKFILRDFYSQLR